MAPYPWVLPPALRLGPLSSRCGRYRPVRRESLWGALGGRFITLGLSLKRRVPWASALQKEGYRPQKTGFRPLNKYK